MLRRPPHNVFSKLQLTRTSVSQKKMFSWSSSWLLPWFIVKHHWSAGSVYMHQHSLRAFHWPFMVECGCIEGGIWGWSTYGEFQVDLGFMKVNFQAFHTQTLIEDCPKSFIWGPRIVNLPLLLRWRCNWRCPTASLTSTEKKSQVSQSDIQPPSKAISTASITMAMLFMYSAYSLLILVFEQANLAIQMIRKDFIAK